jgi:ABC-type glycerol-3-phosphate transport system permease component
VDKDSRSVECGLSAVGDVLPAFVIEVIVSVAASVVGVVFVVVVAFAFRLFRTKSTSALLRNRG